MSEDLLLKCSEKAESMKLGEMETWLDTKKLKQDLKKQWLFVEKGQLMGYKKRANDTDTAFKHFFEKNHPNDKCLNFLPFDDALKLFKECA